MSILKMNLKLREVYMLHNTTKLLEYTSKCILRNYKHATSIVIVNYKLYYILLVSSHVYTQKCLCKLTVYSKCTTFAFKVYLKVQFYKLKSEPI